MRHSRAEHLIRIKVPARSSAVALTDPMEPELAMIQKLRRDHRELLERFADTLRRFRRSPLPPSAPNALALYRLVDFLQTRVPLHFRKEACLSCPSFRECGAGRAKPEASACGGDFVAGGRDEHQELARQIARLADTTVEAAATGDGGLWQQAVAQTAELEQCFAGHIAGEEQAFKQRLLESGTRRATAPRHSHRA